ncbi:MAG: AEC family transporter [Propionibacteriaceae bacterium]|jgi:predicted permease|nr:AEC family transporter [Propionibacteriaceae bacterium]
MSAQDFLIPAQQVAVIFVIIVMGWVVYRTKLVKPKGVDSMTNLLLYVVNPCLIIMSFQIDFDLERFGHFFLAVLIDCIALFALVWLSRLFYPAKLIDDPNKRSALRFGTIYTNVGFYGIPLTRALLGDEGVFYLIAFLLAFALFVWTQGVNMFEANTDRKTQLRKILLNPNIIATAIAIICFATSFRLPAILASSFNMVADLNTPLSMVVIGCNVAVIPVRTIFKGRGVWYGTAISNVLVPLLALLAIWLVPVEPVIKQVFVLAFACPVGAMLVMFSVRYKRSPDFATRFLCLSTLISIVTLPGVVALSGVLL